MRRIIALFLVAALVLELPLPLFSQTKNTARIAIMDFQNTSGNSNLDYLQESIPEMLITNLAKEERLHIVERNRLNDAVKEMQLGMTGLVDQSKAVELGKAVGASAILVGSYLEIGGVIRINARLIDVSSSQVMKAESVQGTSGKEIFNLMDQLATSIINQLVEKKKTDEPKVRQADKISQNVPQNADKRRTQPTPVKKESSKKGGSNTALYVVGGALLIGGGVAAALLLGGSKDDGGGGDNSNVSVTVTLP